MKKYEERVIRWISGLTGFQGGNPGAELWFCGLEYQEVDLDKVLEAGNWPNIEQPPFLDKMEYVKKEHGGQVFNQSLVEIANSYYNGRVKVENPFARDGHTFKLNLFPLPQKASGEAYGKKIYEHTKILTKSELRYLSSHNPLKGENSRFENFNQLLVNNKDSVKAIICCSRTQSAIDSFLLAFGGKDCFFKLSSEIEDSKDILGKKQNRNRYYNWCKLSTGQLMFIIPFMGGRNQNFKSVEDMKWIGKRIKELVEENL